MTLAYMTKISDRTHAPVRNLSVAEDSAIKKWYNDEKLEHRNTLIVANTVLRTAHEHGYWLRCDCNANTPPLFYVRRSTTSNKYVLVRLPKHNHHSTRCPLWSDEIPHESVNGKSGAHLPSILRLLHKLINNAQLHELTTDHFYYENHLKTQYHRIVNEANLIKASKDVVLGENFGTHINAVKSIAMRLKQQDTLLPEQQVGFVCLVVDEIDNQQITAQKTTVSISGKMYDTSGKQIKEAITGPFIGLFMISHTQSNGSYYQITSGAVVPVYSRRLLMPVVNPQAWSTIAILVNAQKWLNEKRNQKVRIISHYEKNTLQDGSDFKIIHEGGTIFVRSMPHSSNIQFDEGIIYHLFFESAKKQEQSDKRLFRMLTGRILSARNS